MRIAMVAPHFHPEVGGLETSVRLLGNWLAARGHEVTVHTSARVGDHRVLSPSEAVDGIQIRRYPLRLDLGYFRSAFRPDLGAADVVHLHGYAVLTNDLAARRARAPIAYSLHHGVSMPHPTPWTRLERALYDRFIGLGTLRRVGAIVAANRGDAAWLRARGLTRVEVIPTPLTSDAFVPGRAEQARERFGTGRFVLFLGRLHVEKGVLELVTALAGLPDVNVRFAGPDAGAAEDVRRRAADLGISDRVRVLGEVSEEVKRDLLAACEFLVLPSAYEAQAIAVGEAWAQGKAVVASRVGALAEWVEEGRTGLLVPPGDTAALRSAIAELLGNPGRAQSMGRRGAERAPALRVDRLGPEFESLYARLSGRKGAERP